jgi:DNA-directed RNA polymerase subunit H
MASIVPQLLPLEIDNETKTNRILENVIRMLTNRKLLDKDKLEDNIKKILEEKSDDYEYKIKLDETKPYYSKDTKELVLKIYNQKVTGLAKGSILDEFIRKNIAKPKIIVVQDITSKVEDQIIHKFQNTEIFVEKNLLIDLVTHIYVPKHELLTPEEGEIILEEYYMNKRTIPKILTADPISKYFNAKIGDVFRIIRPSEITGESVFYRRVYKGNSGK